MRDPGRIDEIMEHLTKTWKEYPQLRLMQLLYSINGLGDTFYLEDDIFFEKLKDFS